MVDGSQDPRDTAAQVHGRFILQYIYSARTRGELMVLRGGHLTTKTNIEKRRLLH
jgi:hypothetical protein